MSINYMYLRSTGIIFLWFWVDMNLQSEDTGTPINDWACRDIGLSAILIAAIGLHVGLCEVQSIDGIGGCERAWILQGKALGSTLKGKQWRRVAIIKVFYHIAITGNSQVVLYWTYIQDHTKQQLMMYM